MTKQKVLNIGIDLGTSRSVIACDNGVRTFIPSYVGFPKDTVSRKFFGKDILFGDEALKNKPALELHRPFDKGVLKFSDDPEKTVKDYKFTVNCAKQLLTHLVSLATNGEPGEYSLRGVVGTPALASRKNKQTMMDICEGVLDYVLVASEPFCVAYGLNLLGSALIIDIGAGTVDMCRMHGTVPAEDDQITLTKGGDHIDGIFFDLVKSKYPEANFTTNMLKKFKEENATITGKGEELFITLPINGKPTELNVTEEIKAACRTIVPDLVEGIGKLISTYDPEFQDDLKQNVILAGGGSQMIGLRKEIEDHMRKHLGYGRVSRVEEPVYAGANGALLLCRDMPEEYWTELRPAATATQKVAAMAAVKG
ncbi:MAG: MamK family actin-like protein [Nitrospirota bacterium]|nr:MamK family actin-like protein [Nitrospirota bacterium]